MAVRNRSPLILAVWSCLLYFGTSSVSALMRGNFAVQPHPLQFNEEPNDWMVSVGSSVSLTCNTSVVQIVGYLDEERTPSPQIEWIHNNVTISSGGHYTINNSNMGTSILTITNVTLVEQGDYHCLVHDWKKQDGGWWTSTRSRSGHITVLVASNSSVTVYEHDNILLSCVETMLSTPSDGVVWMKNGEMISEQSTTSSELLIVGVSEDDGGQYQCNDPVDNIILSSYQLVILSTNAVNKPQMTLGQDFVGTQFVRIKSNLSGCPAEADYQSVSLYCNATGYQEMIWYKNGQLLDVNSSTDIVFNQTTSSWTITKNNPCDLLGVYQCFVSNEVGTVHVSTRVLPLGWPNHPGRPELLDHSSFSDGFRLVVKIYPPDYLGGLMADQLMYEVCIEGSLNAYRAAADITTNTTINVELLDRLDSIYNRYFLYAQLRVEADLPLGSILALPTGSPFLHINPYCELIDYPPPIVEETCHYNDTGDFVTHNISWRVEGSVLNYVFADNVPYWIVQGDCVSPNGTVTKSIHIWLQKRSKSFQLVDNSSCRVSVIYATRCYYSPRSFNTPCNYTTISVNDSTRANDPTKANDPTTAIDSTRVNDITTAIRTSDSSTVPPRKESNVVDNHTDLIGILVSSAALLIILACNVLVIYFCWLNKHKKINSVVDFKPL